MRYETGMLQPTFLFKVADVWHDISEFVSVWYRRPRSVLLANYALDQEGRTFARDEWQTLVKNFYDFISAPLWISHPNALERAANKILQLTIAKQLGLTTPETLISSDVEAAKEFIDKHHGQVIVKPTGKGWMYDVQGKAVTYVMTNRITNNDMKALEDIRIAPVTFQKEIIKAFEVRVNIVGQTCLAIKIDSQKSEVSKVDWRRYDVSNTPYTPFELPKDIERKCLLVCKWLRLEFGAIDLICQPDGSYVFLEVNGNGQFLWAEQLSGVKVSRALARLLAGETPALANISEDTGDKLL